jgi:PTH1 family peptidyl-tRNA hydrolase
MSDRWVVAGLGNPEDEYGGTRHNVGADVVRRLAADNHATFSTNKRIRCQEAQVRVGDQRLLLVLPMTYMNRSGDPVQAASNWFDAPPEQVVLVHDDLDLDLGQLRCKLGGGSAHNGVRDVVRAMGTRDVLRVRVGIGQPPGRMPGRDYVLGRFSSAEQDDVALVVADAADAVESLVREGLEPTQNRYHSRTKATP